MVFFSRVFARPLAAASLLLELLDPADRAAAAPASHGPPRSDRAGDGSGRGRHLAVAVQAGRTSA
ncbi:hypothetical protein AB5I41_16750 [Sphingomonas sp. MMS24-JH45]